MTRAIIARQAILVALASLIPVPFLDSWVQRKLRAQLIRSLSSALGVPMEPQAVHQLSGVQSNILVGCLLGTLWWPIKKLIRKVVYVLTLKDALDSLSDTFIRGEMLCMAFRSGLLPAEFERVHQAMERSLSTHARSPLWGPKVPHEGHLVQASDLAWIRGLAKVAERGGGVSALARFEHLLTNHEELPPEPVSSHTPPDPSD